MNTCEVCTGDITPYGGTQFSIKSISEVEAENPEACVRANAR